MNTATVAIVRLDRASWSTGSRLRTGSGGGARAAWTSPGPTPAPWGVCWAPAVPAPARRGHLPGGEAHVDGLALRGQGLADRLGGGPDQPDVEPLGLVGPEELGQEDDRAQDAQGDQGGDEERLVAPGPLDPLAAGGQLYACEGGGAPGPSLSPPPR